MHALMELFSDKHMNQDFIRIRQADAREPVASPPPARSRRETSTECAFPHKAPPREEVEEAPMEVKTPGVLAAEAAKAGVIPEAFLRKQMGVLDAMLTKLGGESIEKSFYYQDSTYRGLAHSAGIRFGCQRVFPAVQGNGEAG